MLKKMVRRVGGVSLVGAAGSALAAPPDFTALTAAVDYSTVISSVLGIAALAAVLYITWKGAKMVITAIRGF